MFLVNSLKNERLGIVNALLFCQRRQMEPDQHTDRAVLSSVIAFTKANASEVADLILSTLPSSNRRMEALS